MTREEIMRLEGPELDATVHERVFGRRAKWATKKISINGGEWLPWRRVLADPDTGEEVPHYSIDIDAAWQVVDELTAMGYQFELSFIPGCEKEPWLALFFVPPRRVDSASSALAATAAEAICRAALLALAMEALGVEAGDDG